MLAIHVGILNNTHKLVDIIFNHTLQKMIRRMYRTAQ